MNTGRQIILNWFKDKGWQPFPFQEEVWEYFENGYSGLLNAPTGTGKTYALWMPVLINFINKNPDYKNTKAGLRAIWITPLRALAKDIQEAMQSVCDDVGLHWEVARRTGDTTTSERQRQVRKPPQALVITPESMHILFAGKDHEKLFKDIETVIVDEWHELIGSKRGVQTELVLARLRTINPKLRIWGISATIGNMDESVKVLLGPVKNNGLRTVLKADVEKKINFSTLLPDEIERFPWSGHYGTHMAEKVLPVIRESKSTLVFCNTRSQSEIWYQYLLMFAPELAGNIALHHGSLDNDIRSWVEQALHEERLKVVVCTSSLDLGVDFRPVETVVQVGSPKGVSRFLQRAGRSGHQPGATSRIIFVPTHSIELLEAASLHEAMKRGLFEDRIPFKKPYDVLIQYMVTIAVSGGFKPRNLFLEVRKTHAYKNLTWEEFKWMLDFIHKGGETLNHYDEFKKVEKENGKYLVKKRAVATRHRLSMGTIVGDTDIRIRYVSGGNLGSIEEMFISRLNPGDCFWFAGKNLELVRIRGMTAYVKKTSGKKGVVPSWMGSRMPLSSQLAQMLRLKMHEVSQGVYLDEETVKLKPLLEVQKKWSHLPSKKEFLIEKIISKEGYHLFVYPFEGRYVHEGISALIAYRIALLEDITFSIAMNDYGFELLSDKDIPIEDALGADLFSEDHLFEDISNTLNSTEMSRRKFRDIATISGLIFKGFPGKSLKTRHLQSSSSLIYEVFKQYEPNHPLLLQAADEVMQFQFEEKRLRKALKRINSQKIILTYPKRMTPFAFPIMVDGLSRERLTSEKMIDRIERIKLQLERAVEDE